jgi:hypothetical protein
MLDVIVVISIYGHYACEYECLVNNKEKTNYVDGK